MFSSAASAVKNVPYELYTMKVTLATNITTTKHQSVRL